MPKVSLDQRRKLIKLTQGCSKKFIERYFNIDFSTHSMVYYEQQNDQRPKKSVNLKECIIRIESKEVYSRLPAEERKSQESTWKEESQNYRVAIISSSRNNKPVYNYASTREEAFVLTMQISNTLSTLEYKSQLKSLIKYVSDTDKHSHFTALHANTLIS